jgi:hypothetical protein
VMRPGARVEELISDVGENGGAARRDSASGDKSEETGQELAEINRGRELGELGEEVGREVFGIVVQLQGSGGLGKAEMVRTEAEVMLRASEVATLPIGEAIQATGGIIEGDAGRFRENSDAGICLGGFMMFLPDFPAWGYTPGNLYRYQKKRLMKFAFRKCLILKEMSFAEQNG